jgi:hypothetical protein
MCEEEEVYKGRDAGFWDGRQRARRERQRWTEKGSGGGAVSCYLLHTHTHTRLYKLKLSPTPTASLTCFILPSLPFFFRTDLASFFHLGCGT